MSGVTILRFPIVVTEVVKHHPKINCCPVDSNAWTKANESSAK